LPRHEAHKRFVIVSKKHTPREVKSSIRAQIKAIRSGDHTPLLSLLKHDSLNATPLAIAEHPYSLQSQGSQFPNLSSIPYFWLKSKELHEKLLP
jgi:hypothetical protein